MEVDEDQLEVALVDVLKTPWRSLLFLFTCYCYSGKVLSRKRKKCEGLKIEALEEVLDEAVATFNVRRARRECQDG